MEQEQSASAPAVVSERWVEEVKLIQEVAPEATWEEAHGYLEVTIPAERLVAVGFALRDRLQYQYLSSVTAVDWLEHFELLYHIYRLDRGEAVVLHVNLPRVEEPW
ncbi:MAG TPA: NADH-quinone oxidoreductase subunit C, partial [Chloroflexota bacterium]